MLSANAWNKYMEGKYFSLEIYIIKNLFENK